MKKLFILTLLMCVFGFSYSQNYVKKLDFGKEWCQWAQAPGKQYTDPSCMTTSENLGWWIYVHNPSGGIISDESFRKIFDKDQDSALIPSDTAYSNLSMQFNLMLERKKIRRDKVKII